MKKSQVKVPIVEYYQMLFENRTKNFNELLAKTSLCWFCKKKR